MNHTQHNLPPLVTVAAIRALTAAQTTTYAVRYVLGNMPLQDELRSEQLDTQ